MSFAFVSSSTSSSSSYLLSFFCVCWTKKISPSSLSLPYKRTKIMNNFKRAQKERNNFPSPSTPTARRARFRDKDARSFQPRAGKKRKKERLIAFQLSSCRIERKVYVNEITRAHKTKKNESFSLSLSLSLLLLFFSRSVVTESRAQEDEFREGIWSAPYSSLFFKFPR